MLCFSIGIPISQWVYSTFTVTPQKGKKIEQPKLYHFSCSICTERIASNYKLFHDASPDGDMMFFAALKMMLLPMVAMMQCLPSCARRHTSLGEAVIISASDIICPIGQIALKKPRQRRGFFVAAVKGFEPLHTESESAVLPLHNTAI